MTEPHATPRRLAAYDPLSPQPTGRALTIAIAVAVLMSLAYAIDVLIDLAKPPLPQSPVWFIQLVPIPFPATWHITEVLMFVAWGIAAVAGAIGFALSRAGTSGRGKVRLCQIVVLVALLLPYVVFPVTTVFGDILHLLVCIPTTAFGLWLLRPMQAFRRVPLRLVLASFGWGATIAAGFSICMTGWFTHYAGNFFLDFTDLEGMQERLFTSIALTTGIFGELGKIAGLTLLFMFFRRRFDGLTSGIVLGAAAGLGLNFVESLQYLNSSGAVSLLNAGGAASQFWSHQVLGLMAGEVAFGAIAGAGFGISRWLPTARQRWSAVLASCLCAMAAHFATDVVLPHFLFDKIRWSRENPWLETLVVDPLLVVGTSGWFVALYLVLLRQGRRAEADGIATAATAEAASGAGAVTPDEASALVNPAARFFLRVSALRDAGAQEYRAVRDLHAAQLDLLTGRWHSTPDEPDLRRRVLVLKHAVPSPEVTS
jgi:RsiW-degrading membrane proteinase PrsW (M82 family)